MKNIAFIEVKLMWIRFICDIYALFIVINYCKPIRIYTYMHIYIIEYIIKRIYIYIDTDKEIYLKLFLEYYEIIYIYTSLCDYVILELMMCLCVCIFSSIYDRTRI